MSIRVKYITCKWISYRSQGEWLWGASRGTKIRERLSGSEPTSRQIAVSDNWMLMSQIIHLICIIYIYHIVIPFSMLDCGLVQCWRQALRSSGVFFLHHLWVRPMGFFMGAEGAQRDILRPASNSRRSHCQPNIFPLDPQTSSDTPWTPERDAHKAQTSWKNTTAFTF